MFGIRSGIGFAIAAFLIGGSREMLSSGTLMGFSTAFRGNMRVFATVCGGFIAISLLSAFWQWLVSFVKSFSFRGGDDE